MELALITISSLTMSIASFSHHMLILVSKLHFVNRELKRDGFVNYLGFTAGGEKGNGERFYGN